MTIIDFIGICVTIFGFIFGLYGLVICLRFVVLPCFIISNVSSVLSNAERAIALAVASGAIPEVNPYRAHFETLAGDFARMRIQNNLSPGLFPQLRLAIRHGLTRRLFFLAWQVEALRQEVEVVLDRWHLALLETPQIVVRAHTPFPRGDLAMPEPLIIAH